MKRVNDTDMCLDTCWYMSMICVLACSGYVTDIIVYMSKMCKGLVSKLCSRFVHNMSRRGSLICVSLCLGYGWGYVQVMHQLLF